MRPFKSKMRAAGAKVTLISISQLSSNLISGESEEERSKWQKIAVNVKVIVQL